MSWFLIIVNITKFLLVQEILDFHTCIILTTLLLTTFAIKLFYEPKYFPDECC